MRIGIISDTHNTLPEKLLGVLDGCDRIIHAGDIARPQILWELEGIAPVIAALGNCDNNHLGNTIHPVAKVTLEGVRFVIVHDPAYLKPELRKEHQEQAENISGASTPMTLIGIHGHLHIPKLISGDAAYPADLILSPGSPTDPRNGNPRSYAQIEVRKGKVLNAYIQDLQGNVLMQYS